MLFASLNQQRRLSYSYAGQGMEVLLEPGPFLAVEN